MGCGAPDEINWEADLSRRIAARRSDLAEAAEREQPAHLVRLVGHPPQESDARERWLASAGAVEAYREQWRVDRDQLGQEQNLHGVRAVEWEGVQSQLARDSAEWDWFLWAQPSPGHGFDLGL